MCGISITAALFGTGGEEMSSTGELSFLCRRPSVWGYLCYQDGADRKKARHLPRLRKEEGYQTNM